MLFLIRRPGNPDKWDLLFIRFGLLAVLWLAGIVAEPAWKWVEPLVL